MHCSGNHLHEPLPCPTGREERVEHTLARSARSSTSSVYLSADGVSPRPSVEDMPDDPGYDDRQGPSSSSQSQIHTSSLKTSISADCAATLGGQSSLNALNGERIVAATVHQVPQSPSTLFPESNSSSSPSPAMSLSERLLSKVGKRRGTASAYSTDQDGTAPEDSDLGAASSSTVRSRVRARLRSLKSVKSSGLTSEVQDASRKPSLKSSASLSNLRLSSPTSPKLSATTTDMPLLEVRVSKDTKRLRSQSVGPPSRPGRTTTRMVKRLSSGFQLHRPEISREFCIAVIGSPKCGKTVFVRKGLKGKALTNQENASASVEIGGKRMEINYTRREAQLANDISAPSKLNVLEFDSRDWKIEEKKEPYIGWLPGLPRPDGIFVCYDGSDVSSFEDIVQLLGFKMSGIPSLAIACKCDLEKRVSPQDAALAMKQSGCRLIEVSQFTDDGKKRMRRAIDVLVQQIIAMPAAVVSQNSVTSDSPQTDSAKHESRALSVLTSHTSLSTASFPSPSRTSRPSQLSPIQTRLDSSSSTSPPLSPSSSSIQSPTRARSMNDIIAEHSKALATMPYESDREKSHFRSLTSLKKARESENVKLSGPAGPSKIKPERSPAAEEPRESTSSSKTEKQKSPAVRPLNCPWTTFNDLLETVFFVAISGDDPALIANFLLTYRRFATPRSILLGMQKRMNELSQPTPDITLASYAQLKLCQLLEQWTTQYPHDFVAPGTSGAFHALTRNILSHTHLLSTYGSDLLAFGDSLSSMHDDDEAWAYKASSVSLSEVDSEIDSLFEPDAENFDTDGESPASSHSPSHSREATSEQTEASLSSARSRRSSLPLGAISFIKNSTSRFNPPESPQAGCSVKELLATLHRAASSLALCDPDVIAREITRRDKHLFLRIKRRDWMRHTYSRGKKDPSIDPIARFNIHYNNLHEWAVSIVLCHDKPKGRARQIEKLAEIASRLRMLNNYSSLRAIITAINQSTFPGDSVMEIFRMKTELYKKFLSSDVLLRTSGAHQSYRMALRNTRGACVPSLEVHLSDLRRADEGNADSNPEEPSKINWAKYNMIGQFIAYLATIQERCSSSDEYDFPENTYIGQLLDVPVMDYELQQSRMAPPSEDPLPAQNSMLNLPQGPHKEPSMLRRLWQW